MVLSVVELHHETAKPIAARPTMTRVASSSDVSRMSTIAAPKVATENTRGHHDLPESLTGT